MFYSFDGNDLVVQAESGSLKGRSPESTDEARIELTGCPGKSSCRPPGPTAQNEAMMESPRSHVRLDKFVALVTQSGLITQEALDERLDPLLAKLIDRLVAEGLLTRWQCEKLLSGKYRGFFLDECIPAPAAGTDVHFLADFATLTLGLAIPEPYAARSLAPPCGFFIAPDWHRPTARYSGRCSSTHRRGGRMTRVVLLAAALLCLVGCEDEEAAVPVVPAAPQAGPRGLSGPWIGILNQTEVEAFIHKQIKLTNLTLTSTGGGGYTGYGLNFDGSKCTLEVKQVSGGISCKYVASPQWSGRTSTGNHVEDD